MLTKYIASLLVLFSCVLSGQNTEVVPTGAKKKGNFYACWGYTRAWYSRSTIHFENHSNKTSEYNGGRPANYDFTVYNAKAHDRPDFEAIPDIVNLTIPQFVIHAGYYFNDKHDLGIEFNYDHTKYIVEDFQTAHIKGQFNGAYVDTDTNITNIFHFEHSDGANFFMLNFMKRFKIYNPGNRLNIGWTNKAGLGIVYPRTDVTMFGERLNNDWHIAGWITGVETGLRIEFLRYGCFEFVGKGSFADYRKVLVLGKGNGKANHSFFAAQLTAVIGLMF